MRAIIMSQVPMTTGYKKLRDYVQEMWNAYFEAKLSINDQEFNPYSSLIQNLLINLNF